jgi:trans-2,3-dihydro-3-hydroxyanthranilate isomerase
MKAGRSYRYRVVDVFTERPLEGNGLAVFTDAAGMDDDTMQKVAREMNLSETTFVLPATRPGCAARIRIFTPARELGFAGHPTVGSAFVLMDEGVASGERFVLDEKAGPVPVRVEAGERPRLWLTTPPISVGGTRDRALCARALGVDPGDLLDVAPQVVSAGNPALFVALRDRGAVDRAWLDLAGLPALRGDETESMFVFVFAPTPEGAYSRMFAPDFGVTEDPATGSATGPLAVFMMRNALVSNAPGTRFVSEQGTKMRRRSLLHVLVHGAGGADGIEVGGHVTPVVEATLHI